MAKRKKRSRFRARTIWAMIISYLVLGVILALIYLEQNAPEASITDANAQVQPTAWALFPIVVMLWPLFLVILLVQIFF
jgi:hypothetical protein